ncbi:hypothetical protein ACGLWX_08535 [Halomonas sp. HMF6819]|uniref:hypothetical protein n=1 Tax=Halomonas sp. HMF6819 TaxID=3373085 RepID=UPI0037A9233D
MKNINNLKGFLIYLFFYLQIFSFSFSYIYWRQFGINVQGYMTYGDIVFSQATNVVIFVCVLAFLIFAYFSYLKRNDRKEVKYPKLYFLLSVAVSVVSFFILLNRGHAVLHEFVMPLFSMSILLIPIFFTFCPWFEKYFSSAQEAIVYSATFVAGFYILTIWPAHSAKQDF